LITSLAQAREDSARRMRQPAGCGDQFGERRSSLRTQQPKHPVKLGAWPRKPTGDHRVVVPAFDGRTFILRRESLDGVRRSPPRSRALDRRFLCDLDLRGFRRPGARLIASRRDRLHPRRRQLQTKRSPGVRIATPDWSAFGRLDFLGPARVDQLRLNSLRRPPFQICRQREKAIFPQGRGPLVNPMILRKEQSDKADREKLPPPRSPRLRLSESHGHRRLQPSAFFAARFNRRSASKRSPLMAIFSTNTRPSLALPRPPDPRASARRPYRASSSSSAVRIVTIFGRWRPALRIREAGREAGGRRDRRCVSVRRSFPPRRTGVDV